MEHQSLVMTYPIRSLVGWVVIISYINIHVLQLSIKCIYTRMKQQIIGYIPQNNCWSHTRLAGLPTLLRAGTGAETLAAGATATSPPRALSVDGRALGLL